MKRRKPKTSARKREYDRLWHLREAPGLVAEGGRESQDCSTWSKMTLWRLSHRADPRALPLADRHYNRQKPGTPQFVPPGRCLVLITPNADALWVSSWPFTQYVKHAWAGAWICSCFRNESSTLSSSLITEAVSITRWFWSNPPPLGIVTFVDASKVRHKRDPGRCYRRAGWSVVGHTKGHLIALQLKPDAMPPALEPSGAQRLLDFIPKGL